MKTAKIDKNYITPSFESEPAKANEGQPLQSHIS
jgi:hypothetical protein